MQFIACFPFLHVLIVFYLGFYIFSPFTALRIASIVEAEASDDWKPDGSEIEEEDDTEEESVDSDASANADTEVIDEDEDDYIIGVKESKASKSKPPSMLMFIYFTSFQ